MSVMKGNFLERSSYITVLERERERERVNNEYTCTIIITKTDHLPKSKDIRPLAVRVKVTASLWYLWTWHEYSKDLGSQVVELGARNDNITLLTLNLRTTVEEDKKIDSEQHTQYYYFSQ